MARPIVALFVPALVCTAIVVAQPSFAQMFRDLDVTVPWIARVWLEPVVPVLCFALVAVWTAEAMLRRRSAAALALRKRVAVSGAVLAVVFLISMYGWLEVNSALPAQVEAR